MTQEKSLAVVEAEEPQPGAIAKLDAGSIADAIQNAIVLGEIIKRRFVKDHHYMHIPGSPSGAKPHVMDDGVDLIANGFKVRAGPYRVAHFSIDEETGHMMLALQGEWVHILTGLVVSSGIGGASSHEVKYAYRWVPRVEVPLGIDVEGLPRRQRKSDGAALYRIDNPDIGDLYNTLWKMAAKRCRGDGVMHLPGCSEIFADYVIAPPRAPKEKILAPAPPATREELERDADELFTPAAKPQPQGQRPTNEPSQAPKSVGVTPSTISQPAEGGKQATFMLRLDPPTWANLVQGAMERWDMRVRAILAALNLQNPDQIRDIPEAWATLWHIKEG